MTVRKILDSKGHGVVSIDPESTLATAVKTLSERKIGAILVMGSDQRLEGILSERDIVRVLGQRGPEVLSSPVSATMTAKVLADAPIGGSAGIVTGATRTDERR